MDCTIKRNQLAIIRNAANNTSNLIMDFDPACRLDAIINANGSKLSIVLFLPLYLLHSISLSNRLYFGLFTSVYSVYSIYSLGLYALSKLDTYQVYTY